MRLSPSFTLDQLIHSDTAQQHGVDNRPLDAHLPNLRRLAAALEAIQKLLRQPLFITSAYRNPKVNKLVGGVPASKHALGLAADFVCPAFGAPLAVARAIAASAIEYDQLIHEYGRWAHLGLAPSGVAPRAQLLTICSGAGGYQDGLLPCPNASVSANDKAAPAIPARSAVPAAPTEPAAPAKIVAPAAPTAPAANRR